MEEITHYPISTTKENGEENNNITYIPLDNIILDKGMSNKGKEKCDTILKNKKVKILKNGISTELYKWDKVEKDFKEKKEMDPIKVKRFKDTRYYNIIDGRHRCMLSLFFEYTHIPANILD